ncbi:alcohol dehydrogenase class-3-like [Armigeres subalbatus]|uniref:alcohol dehydrogenase class-3-like n=1 Tax=Armigeres subalbatus TaxID=124917 RepID=UPI002ED42348
MSETTGKVITCKAAVAWEPNKPLTVETIEVAPPKAGEIRIKVVATGVCHSDASFLSGYDPSIRFPVIFGHEGAGIVESVGEGVTKFKPGDHVIPLFIPQCFECRPCKNPNTNLCKKMRLSAGDLSDGTSRFTCKGKQVFHCMSTSTFSQYTVVEEDYLCKIDESAPLDKVCLLGCGISTGYGTALNSAKVNKGSSCAVWGLGAVGLAAVMGCKAAGATRIIGVDINPAKFEIAKQFGCTEFVNPKDYDEPIQQVLMKKTQGGLDYTIECVGNVLTMRAALESTAPGWGVSVIVGVAEYESEVSTRAMEMLLGRTWKGAVYGGWKSVECIPELVNRYMKQELMLDEFITHTMPIDEINEAFRLMREGKSIRSVIIN